MADYKAQGYSGLKGRPKLRKDVDKMTDKERRRKRIERNVEENKRRQKRGEKPRTLTARDVDKLMAKTASPKQKIRQLQTKAADMRAKASGVERSGTGNKAAAATYRKVAGECLKRITALRGKK